MARRPWRRLAMVPALAVAVLAAPGSAVAAQEGHGAAPVSAAGVARRGPTAYVTIAGYTKPGHTVRPIATATDTAGKPIKVGKVPGAIAITPDGRTVYVANFEGSLSGASTVTPIATATNTPGKPIKVGRFPSGIAITPDGTTAYVTNSGSDTVTPIATATNKPGKPIPAGVHPGIIVITPNGRTAYVLNYGTPSTVTPITVATDKPGRPIRVGNGPLAMAVTPNGKTVYVANANYGSGHTVTPISTATDRPGRPIRVGSAPSAIAITPNGKVAYVVNSDHGKNGTVTPIATVTNTPGQPIKVGGFPWSIAITPDGKTAYVVSLGAHTFSRGTVTPISTATNKPGKPIEVGSEPAKIAITLDGKTAYVADSGSDVVTPINTATNTAGKPIKVGCGPGDIAITPSAAPAGTMASGPAVLPTALAAPRAGRPVHVLSAAGCDIPARPAVATAPAGPESASALPSAPLRLPGPLLAVDLGGARYEIPQAALPYLGRGLNPDLFRLSSLTRWQSGGRLPVIITYHGRRPVLPGVTITRTGRGSAAGYLTAAGGRAFVLALARQFKADHARGSYGRDGLFAGGAWIGLAGAPVRPRATVPHSPRETLTLTGTNLAGKLDTGDMVWVFNADDSKRFADPVESHQVFSHGVARFSVPPGHYWAIGFFTNLYPGIHLAVLPQFTVSRATTVHMDGRTADSKLTMVTPRPAAQEFASLTLRHPTPAGPAEVVQEISAQAPVPILVSPTTRRPTVGTLQVFPFEQLLPLTLRTPYVYDLAYSCTSGLIPPLRHVVSAASLATVRASYYDDAAGDADRRERQADRRRQRVRPKPRQSHVRRVRNPGHAEPAPGHGQVHPVRQERRAQRPRTVAG